MITYFRDSNGIFNVTIEDAINFKQRGMCRQYMDFYRECPNVFLRNKDGREFYFSFELIPHPDVIANHPGIMNAFNTSLGEFIFWLSGQHIYMTRQDLEKQLLKVFTPLLKKRVTKNTLSILKDGVNVEGKFTFNFPNGVLFESSTHQDEKDRAVLVLIGNYRLYGRFTTVHKVYCPMQFFNLNWLVNELLVGVRSTFVMLPSFDIMPYSK